MQHVVLRVIQSSAGVDALYDFDLHMRFIKSATEAWFSYATAGFAALSALQDRLANGNIEILPPAAPAPIPAGPYGNMFSWWLDMFTPKAAAAPAGVADFGAAAFQFSPFAAAFKPFAWGSSSTANPWMDGWQDMMKSMMQGWGSQGWGMQGAQAWGFPQMSWSAFQMPMTAWLMAAGLPYSVAEPTARGNTASMDAAAAARESLDRIFSSMRTDGGHALSPGITFLPKRPS